MMGPQFIPELHASIGKETIKHFDFSLSVCNEDTRRCRRMKDPYLSDGGTTNSLES